MNEEQQGVNNGEGTSTNSPIEKKPMEEQTPNISEDGKTQEQVPSEVEEGMIPRSRFNEVLNQRNQYKELLETKSSTPVAQSTNNDDDSDEALKIVEGIADKKVQAALAEVKREMALDKAIREIPDFYDYADQIKSVIGANPLLNWNDAYKIAKFDSVESKAKEQGIAEGQKQVQNLQAAKVESGSPQRPAVASDQEIDPMARDANGKFIYSMSELEGVLPKGKNE
jgi:hypothetical protein